MEWMGGGLNEIVTLVSQNKNARDPYIVLDYMAIPESTRG